MSFGGLQMKSSLLLTLLLFGLSVTGLQAVRFSPATTSAVGESDDDDSTIGLQGLGLGNESGPEIIQSGETASLPPVEDSTKVDSNEKW